MRYGICNETFGDWPLDEALQFARQQGYEGWEVAPFMLTGDVAAYPESERKAYRQQVEEAGFEIIGLHWLLAKTEGFHLTTTDQAMRQRTTEYLCELARLCRDLGGEVMVLGSPQQRNVPEGQSMESAMENAAEVIRGAVPELEKQSVRIAIEPLGREEGNFLNHAADGRKLQAMVNSPHVQLHLDVKAMSDEPTAIDHIIRENAEAMIHFHANDPNRRGPGMGEVDYVPIMRALKEIGYDGWVSVEVFDYTPGIEALVTESIRNLKAARESA